MKYFVKPTPNESVFGLIYYILQLLIIPGILVVVSMMLAAPPSETIINVLFFAFNFVAVLIIFRKFLTANLCMLLDDPWYVLRFAGIGALIYMVGNTVFSLLITVVDPGFANINDAAIMDMVQENFGLMTLGTVVLVPVAEECFYRGLIFRNLYDKSPVWAYAASMVLFSLAHVLGLWYSGPVIYSVSAGRLCSCLGLPAQRFDFCIHFDPHECKSNRYAPYEVMLCQEFFSSPPMLPT